MILKLLITLIFTATALGKLSGKMGSTWDRWGYSRLFMKATGAAELVALGLFWSPGLELVGAAALGMVLLGALATLFRQREGVAHIAFTALTFLLVILQSYRLTVA
jgi:hypothetical protein